MWVMAEPVEAVDWRYGGAKVQLAPVHKADYCERCMG